MSCYNPNCSALPPSDPAVEPPGLLRRAGRELLLMTQRRQAGRARLGRLLDARWTSQNGPKVPCAGCDGTDVI